MAVGRSGAFYVVSLDQFVQRTWTEENRTYDVGNER